MARVRAALVVLLGLVLAAGMVTAGWWQLEVYRRQGAEAAAARAAEPARPLPSVVRAGSPVQDGYGRTVTLRGAYEGEHQVQVALPDRTDAFRVVTLLRLDNGDAVAVIRGVVTETTAGPPPVEVLEQSGILLPSEEAVDPSARSGELSSVRIAQLAQRWPGPLVDGLVVLGPAEAQAQGLTPAEVALPEARGRLRNGAYALQWWLFAAFAVVMAIRIARDVARSDLAVEEPQTPGTTTP
jgi:surfeit locus 1 family protein